MGSLTGICHRCTRGDHASRSRCNSYHCPAGPCGGGKTSLIEALLHRGGALHAAGSVERGTTVCDSDPLERKYHHSLTSAVTHLDHADTRLYLIDTRAIPTSPASR